MIKRIVFVVILMVLMFSSYTPKAIASDREPLFPLEGKTVTLLAYKAAANEYEYSEALLKIPGLEDPLWLELISLQYRKAITIDDVTFLQWGTPYYKTTQGNLNITGIWHSDGFHGEIREDFIPTSKDTEIYAYYDSIKNTVLLNGGKFAAADSPYAICVNMLRNFQYTDWPTKNYETIWYTCFNNTEIPNVWSSNTMLSSYSLELSPPDFDSISATAYVGKGLNPTYVMWWYNQNSVSGLPIKPGIAFDRFECSAETCYPIIFYTATGEEVILESDNLYLHFAEDKNWDYYWFIHNIDTTSNVG